MKAALFIVILALSVVLAGLDPSEAKKTPDVTSGTRFPSVSAATAPRPALPQTFAADTVVPAWPPASAASPAHEPQPVPRIIPQGATELASGHAYNLLAEDDALRLPADAPMLADVGQAVGVYISPIREIKTPQQQQEEAFDTIHFDYDFHASVNSALKFEFRTIAVDEEGEGWSAWREIPPEERNAPIAIERTAEKFQYRILLAQAPGGNAEIRNIKVVTLQDPAKAAQLFNYGSP